MISFGDKQRELGESARQKKITNFKNTVAYFKHFVGREWKDPEIQELLKRDAIETEEMPDGTVGFKVRAYGQKKVTCCCCRTRGFFLRDSHLADDAHTRTCTLARS